jgi:hypothetical protein
VRRGEGILQEDCLSSGVWRMRNEIAVAISTP